MFEVVRVFTDEVVVVGRFADFESAKECALEWMEILGARFDEFIAVKVDGATVYEM